MPENPLLPHRKLRELYTLMQHCRDLDKKTRKAFHPVAAREATLAATTIHLQPGDLLSTDPSDLTLAELAPASKSKQLLTSLLATPANQPRLALCAAAASGLQSAANESLLLAFTTAGKPNPSWTTALEWAQTAQLPLLLTCIDPSHGAPIRRPGAKAAEPILTLPSITAFARKLHLPILPVDGEDAVAVYRVMQESALRARLGGGPAVIWAMMTPSSAVSRLSRAQQPIARLQSYMAARKISLPA